jgi:hypothetical protein
MVKSEYICRSFPLPVCIAFDVSFVCDIFIVKKRENEAIGGH